MNPEGTSLKKTRRNLSSYLVPILAVFFCVCLIVKHEPPSCAIGGREFHWTDFLSFGVGFVVTFVAAIGSIILGLVKKRRNPSAKILAIFSAIYFAGALYDFLIYDAYCDVPFVRCDLGPIKKTFGGTDWLLSSCRSDSSGVPRLIIVPAPGSPAKTDPKAKLDFYFFKEKNGFRLEVENEGNSNSLVDAAYSELIKLSEDEVTKLVSATRSNPKPE